MSNHGPTGITADRNKKTLSISWEDGTSTEIPFARLRAACPCAQCRGGHENMSDTPDPLVFQIPLRDARENEVTDVQLVGNYGLTVAWGDGHKFGIYTWDYLRKLGGDQDFSRL